MGVYTSSWGHFKLGADHGSGLCPTFLVGVGANHRFVAGGSILPESSVKTGFRAVRPVRHGKCTYDKLGMLLLRRLSTRRHFVLQTLEVELPPVFPDLLLREVTRHPRPRLLP